MKKGFTLIELLAVIAVLAVIILIASNIVLNVLENSKIEAYKNNEKMFVKAAETYLANNQLMLPALNNKIEISLDTLKTNKFITSIKDPKDNSDCTGYIIVSNVEGIIIYTPHLRCDTTANNSSEDNLILHYTFDEEKESTQNIYTGPTTLGMYMTSVYSGNYGFGVGTNSKWEIDNSDQPIKTQNVQKISRIDSGINQRFYVMWSDLITKGGTTFLPGEERTLSFYYYGTFGTRINPYIGGHTGNLLLFADNAVSGSGTTSITLPVTTNEWQRVSFRIKNMDATNSTYNWGWMILHSNQIDATISNEEYFKFTGIQQEKKSYTTKYTDTTRLDIVKDLSSNNNNSTLTVLNTPKWSNNMYQFNGINNYISVPNNPTLNLGNSGTISFFAKSIDEYPSIDTNNAFHGIISKSINGTAGGTSYVVDWMGTNSTRILRCGIGNSTDSITVQKNDFNFNNEFNHISYKWDTTNLTLFINGKKVTSVPQTISPQIIANNLEIGRAYSSSSYSFNGYIDDVRIYNRALSDNEIEAIYNTNIDKYK